MSLEAVSPLDGRYAAATREIASYFSEEALIRYRVQVEIAWLRALSKRPEIAEVRAFTAAEDEILERISSGVDSLAAERVKEIESTTRHDVKAVGSTSRSSSNPLRWRM